MHWVDVLIGTDRFAKPRTTRRKRAILGRQTIANSRESAIGTWSGGDWPSNRQFAERSAICVGKSLRFGYESDNSDRMSVESA